jgi:HlyD family type I secretion membrane fusion protein
MSPPEPMQLPKYRAVFGFITLLFVTFIIGALFVPLKGGTTLQGTLSVEFKKRPIQHPSGGIIKKIYVAEGAEVRAGQVLAELEIPNVTAQEQISSIQRARLMAMLERLQAESMNQTDFNFSRELVRLSQEDPRIKKIIQNESSVFFDRWTTLNSSLKILDENITSYHSEIVVLKNGLTVKQRQLELAKKDLDIRRKLYESAFISASGLIEFETRLEQVASAIEDEKAQIVRTERALVESRSKRDQLIKQRKNEIAEKLSDASAEYQQSLERLTANKRDLEHLSLVSPVRGRVMDISILSAGAVLQGSQVLMFVVPIEEELIVQVNIPTHKISGVSEGNQAVIKIRGPKIDLTFEGTIQTIARDQSQDKTQANLGAYYIASVRLKFNPLASEAHMDLRSGMPAEILVVTEERTIATYLLKPVLTFFEKAMTEI